VSADDSANQNECASTGIDKSTLVLQFSFPTKHRLTLSFGIAIVATKPHHMGKYQPVPLA
jgi:hypothetical protein